MRRSLSIPTVSDTDLGKEIVLQTRAVPISWPGD